MRNNHFLLITGAGSGIGRQCALTLSKEYNLILCSRNVSNLCETKEQCFNNQNHLLFPFDLENVDELENSLSTFIRDNNILITKFLSCAASLTMLPLKSIDLEVMERDIKINVISPALILKTLINKRKNSAALENVVFISSNISNRGAKAFSLYGASKSALDGMMRCMAVELSPKVRVNSVLPGPILTDMTNDIVKDSYLDQNEINQKFGKTEFIANIVEFLLSDKSEWITGQQITVDGGKTIDITGL